VSRGENFYIIHSLTSHPPSFSYCYLSSRPLAPPPPLVEYLRVGLWYLSNVDAHTLQGLVEEGS
jgi:hypothetical protein